MMIAKSEVFLKGTFYFLLALELTFSNEESCQCQVFHNLFTKNKFWKQSHFIPRDTKPVPNAVFGRMISSKSPERVCTFDVMNMAYMYKNISVDRRFEVLTFGIVCRRKQNIFFSNISEAKSYLKSSNIVGYLFIRDCTIDVRNLRNLLEVTRFYVADFDNVNCCINSSLIIHENTETFECRGMNFLFGLYVNNVYPVNEFLTDLHICETSYLNMAIVHISLPPDDIYYISNFINIMYPNIQSVSIIRTGLIDIPRFKFTDNVVALPQRMYLPNINQPPYAVHLGFPNHYYQKSFELPGNKISFVPNYAFEGRINMLDIEENVVSVVSEAAFWNVKDLKILRLKGNKISKIPELLLANQSSLLYLDISRNLIRKLNSKMFIYAPNLTFIELSYNHLTMLPDRLFVHHLRLKILAIEFNRIKSVPDNLLPTSNSDLEELSLGSNKIVSLPILIFYSRHLKAIRLNDNRISWESIVSTILRVKYRNFFKRIRGEKMEILGVRDEYMYGRKLNYLDLSNNNIKSIFVRNISMDVKSIFRMVFRYYDIALTGNPILCDCSVIPFIHMIDDLIAANQLAIELPLKKKWTCAEPAELEGTRVFDLASTSYEGVDRGIGVSSLPTPYTPLSAHLSPSSHLGPGHVSRAQNFPLPPSLPP